MDTRKRDKEKEKETNPGDRTPKVQTWTVVKKRHREDSGYGKMCGEWVIPSSGVILVVYCRTCELMLA
ncbi:hypothetical protein Bca52824_026016 [Brassica carinata]|uniref:Uncharacterized protein n=1 Tax=Brassica carinata TaxID=52824 RepID=A0A8X7SH89_BRACI|nr:hypothetical protein Bca52824_026016 [Brassica carinata]